MRSPAIQMEPGEPSMFDNPILDQKNQEYNQILGREERDVQKQIC